LIPRRAKKKDEINDKLFLKIHDAVLIE